MKHSRLRTLLVTLAIVLVAESLFDSIAQTRELPAQDTDKSLDIGRYSKEPVELVDLKVGEQSIKDKIATKSLRAGWELATVTFKERNGWFRRIQVKMRNVSGRPIYGLTAYLYFTPPGSQTRYSLPLMASTNLKQGVSEPGGEITLIVSEQAWSLTADIFAKYSVDPDLAPVKFSIGQVRFASDLMWDGGQLLRPDPNNPNRWNVIDTKVEP